MSKIKLFSLGGLDENGKNMFIIEVDKEIFVFEAGLKYADEFTFRNRLYNTKYKLFKRK